ncbi:acyloxyacyl hydrolase [Pseudotenacibaculum sp. MALMAid0570]|uniref:acyloxyacyl hydrolase n=1 Tax=Pseudotenacibaculum sp. MALMAid0570 TaxID=3143938 RepID=UPI0032E00EAC
MSLNSLPKYLFIFFLFFSVLAIGQEKQKKLKKVGVLFNSAKQNNILFSDHDYDYKTSVFKAQLFYNLENWGEWDFNLIIQPQFQIAKHQLLNPYFITSDEPNYLELRERLTKKRTISLYAFELGFQLKRQVTRNLFFEANFGLGAGYIDVETERLSQGFTFIENISLGFAYSIKESEIYFGSNLGHVSNLNLLPQNSGYNLLGFEIGYRIQIK